VTARNLSCEGVLLSDRSRIFEVDEAEEVIIEIDDSYHTSTPTKRHQILELKDLADFSNILKSVVRKIKYELLLGKVFERGDVGVIPWGFLRDISVHFSGDTMKFEVKNTRPSGEVQVTPNTKITISFSD